MPSSTSNPAATSSIAPVFAVGTGRCGSTMFSEMLSHHPDILSISEFFPVLGVKIFRAGRVDGKWMWKHYSQQTAAVRRQFKRGIVTEEILYPHADPEIRFRLHAIPPILLTTLPHLTDDYEELYDELAEVIPMQGRKKTGEHYRWLFDYLTNRFQRKLWLERSGMSLFYIAKLIHSFPDARFLHIHRDGRDAALSMSRHSYFHSVVNGMLRARQLGMDPFKLLNQVEVPALFGQMLDFLSPIGMSKRLTRRLTLNDFGWFWSELICFGHTRLQQLPPQQRMSLPFETVLEHPKLAMQEAARFMDPSLDDPSWLKTISTIPGKPRSTYRALSKREQIELTNACEPGLRMLRYI
jgi:hypothetical protein